MIVWLYCFDYQIYMVKIGYFFQQRVILMTYCKEIIVFLLPEKINKVKYYERKRQQR